MLPFLLYAFYVIIINIVIMCRPVIYILKMALLYGYAGIYVLMDAPSRSEWSGKRFQIILVGAEIPRNQRRAWDGRTNLLVLGLLRNNVNPKLIRPFKNSKTASKQASEMNEGHASHLSCLPFSAFVLSMFLRQFAVNGFGVQNLTRSKALTSAIGNLGGLGCPLALLVAFLLVKKKKRQWG